MSYQNLKNILGKAWLESNSSHTFNKWTLKPNESMERLLLLRFDSYVQNVTQVLRSVKRTRDKIRHQFEDTYYELEVGCSLMKRGFEVNFEKLLRGKRSQLTPDIFIENDNIIVEVKTLHQSDKAKREFKLSKVFTPDEAKRLQDDLFSELDKYREQGIEHPLIVVVCPDIVEPPSIYPEDFERVLYYQIDKMLAFGSHRIMSSEVEHEGLYYRGYGDQFAILSGVGWWGWKKEKILFFPNPNAKETSKIPQGKFLDYLQS